MLRNFLRAGYRPTRRPINTYRGSPQPFSGILTLRKCNNITNYSRRKIFTNNICFSSQVDDTIDFEEICSETLESLSDYFEELIEGAPNLKGADVIYSDGVLTVALGKNYGTYVINRQSPNKQIWLSSPTSGPKRYDLISENGGYWIYKHDGVTLHQLLQEEISKIAEKVDFKNCSHSFL